MLDPDFFPTAVYRLFNADGELIYIGMGDARSRLKRHLSSKPWRSEIDGSRTRVEWFSTRAEAAARETAAIAAERPKYNIVGNRPNAKPAIQAAPKSRHVDLSRLKPFTTQHYVSTGEISDRLGVSKQRVQQLVNGPTWPIPYDVIAAGRVWLKEDIEAWIAEHRSEMVLT